MLNELFRIGDRVTMKMDREARSWGRKGVPDGSTGVVVGFYQGSRNYGHFQHIDPGLYTFNGVTRVHWTKLPNGSEIDVTDNSGEILLLDTDEQTRREEEFRSLTQQERNDIITAVRNETKVGELPKTEFLVDDFVVSSDHDDDLFRITSIDYNFEYADGSKVHSYQIECLDRVTMERRYSSAAREDRLVLVQRGNLYRELNDLPMEFPDIAAEAIYEARRHRSDEVRNPANGLFSWNKEEVLSAIHNNIVDGFTMPVMFFTDRRHIVARRFHNRNLGERVRKATLAGFALA